MARRHTDQLRRLGDGGSARRERRETLPSAREEQQSDPREESLQPEQVGGSQPQRETSAPQRWAEKIEGEGVSQETHLEGEHQEYQGASPTRLAAGAALSGEAAEAEGVLLRRSSRLRVKPERLVYS
jgi:hypothetical protein